MLAPGDRLLVDRVPARRRRSEVDSYPDSEREAGPELGPRRTGPLVDARRPQSASTRPRRRSRRSRPRPRRPPRRPARRPPRSSRRANDSIRAMMLIRTYRVRGHLAADLDPLGLAKRDLPADLTPEFHGFSGDALDRPIYLGGALGLEQATVREIVDDPAAQLLRPCRPRIYAHRRRRGAALPPGADGRPRQAEIRFTPEGKQAILPEGDPGRAMGEIPRPQICRHQALRPRRRRSR